MKTTDEFLAQVPGVSDAATVRVQEVYRVLSRHKSLRKKLPEPAVRTDHHHGVRTQWSRNSLHVAILIDSDGKASLHKIDCGSAEGGVQELEFTGRNLLEAFRWFVYNSSDNMLIRRAKNAELVPSVDRPITNMELPLVSVVVACYGALECTKELVRTLSENAGCGYELILVDDCCPDNTYLWAEENGIRCIRHETNLGLPTTINDGVAAAKGDVLALWNSDMLVRSNGLRRLAEAAMDCGIAAQTGGYFGSGGEYVGQTSHEWLADYPEGYCLTIRRDVWDDVGEWDPVYHPTICDDSDWAIRARLKGYRWVFVKNAIYHIGGQSVGAAKATPGYVHKNQQVLKSKYAHLGLGSRTLVRRWGAHGDLIMATPALRALKAQQPLAHIHVQCHDEAGVVLKDLPFIDAVFTKLSSAIHYTREINLNGVYEDGQKHGEYKHPALAFCEASGVEFDNKPYDLHVPVAIKEWAREHLPKDFKLVACGLRSANRPKQNWIAASWFELADSLPPDVLLVAMDHSVRPWFDPHGPSPACDQFYNHPQVLDLTGNSPSLIHAAGIISQCDAFVGVDSGLLHVANACGLPTINLCAAAPERARTPLAGLAVAFEGAADCFPCQYPDACPFQKHCLDWVPPHAVVNALMEMLDVAVSPLRVI